MRPAAKRTLQVVAASVATNVATAGTPTTAHHDPEADAAASKASNSDVPPTAGTARPAATATVLPRRSPSGGEVVCEPLVTLTGFATRGLKDP